MTIEGTPSALERLMEWGQWSYGLLLMISMWAGTARYLNDLAGDRPTIAGVLTEWCVSGLVGMLTAMACQYWQMDFLLASVITGISAHNGTRSLYMISKALRRRDDVIRSLADESEDKSISGIMRRDEALRIKKQSDGVEVSDDEEILR